MLSTRKHLSVHASLQSLIAICLAFWYHMRFLFQNNKMPGLLVQMTTTPWNEAEPDALIFFGIRALESMSCRLNSDLIG